MKTYKIKRMPNEGQRTKATIVRSIDGKVMIDGYRQLSVAKQFVKDMNDKTSMGEYLISNAPGQD